MVTSTTDSERLQRGIKSGPAVKPAGSGRAFLGTGDTDPPPRLSVSEQHAFLTGSSWTMKPYAWMEKEGITFTQRELQQFSSNRICAECGHGHESKLRWDGQPYKVMLFYYGKKAFFEAPLLTCHEFATKTGLQPNLERAALTVKGRKAWREARKRIEAAREAPAPAKALVSQVAPTPSETPAPDSNSGTSQSAIKQGRRASVSWAPPPGAPLRQEEAKCIPVPTRQVLIQLREVDPTYLRFVLHGVVKMYLNVATIFVTRNP